LGQVAPGAQRFFEIVGKRSLAFWRAVIAEGAQASLFGHADSPPLADANGSCRRLGRTRSAAHDR